MADVKEEGEIYDEINVVPMLDLAYVLIIIFILMATATLAGVQVNLPRVANQIQLDTKETRAIAVTADGQLYLDGVPVSTGELDAEMRSAYGRDPDVRVVIRGDTVAQYGKIMEVFDILKGIGITKIGLPSEKPRAQ